MKIIRFGDEIGYKAELLLQQRAECNFKEKFQEAQRTFDATNDPMVKAKSAYALYLFYYHGWEVVSKNKDLALFYLKASNKLGYPFAGTGLARHYLEAKKYYKAKKCIKTCEKEFVKISSCEKEELNEEYNDMHQLLKVIESETENIENLSDEGSIGPEEKASPSIHSKKAKNSFGKRLVL